MPAADPAFSALAPYAALLLGLVVGILPGLGGIAGLSVVLPFVFGMDAADALATGAAIGDKIVVIGTSTGATLATAMLDHELAKHIDTLVMISPNFEPRDPGAQWLTRPAGPLLARLAVGDTRCWEPHDEIQARFWSTCYPTAAAVEMMRLVDRANRLLPAEIPKAALEVFEATASPQKAALEITDSDDPSQHVLAGDILSPATTRSVAEAIASFIERPTP